MLARPLTCTDATEVVVVGEVAPCRGARLTKEVELGRGYLSAEWERDDTSRPVSLAIEGVRIRGCTTFELCFSRGRGGEWPSLK